MKISSFVVITEPEQRQDPWLESIASAINFSDEVVVVDGSSEKTFYDNREKLKRIDSAYKPIIKHLNYLWDRRNWSWVELPKHLNYGLRHCTGDWAIRFDADYVFPGEWMYELRSWLQGYNNRRVATFQKYSSVLSRRFYQKGGVQLGINKNAGDIEFGRATDNYTDLCVPIVREGFDKNYDIPFGRLVEPEEIGRCSLDFFNYDYAFKTKEFTRQEFHRFSMAHKRYYGYTKWGETPDAALKVFINMMQERLNRCPYKLSYSQQPAFIQKRLGRIGKNHFAYDGWGMLVDNYSGQLVEK